MVGDIVPRNHVASAVALNSLAFNVARTAGPALGGMIVLAAGPVVAFGANALSFLALVACLLVVRIPRAHEELPREALHRAIAGGVRYVLHAPDVRAVLLRGGVFGAIASVTPALLPLVARETLGGGAPLYGLLLGCFGIGAVGGSLIAPALRRRYPLEQVALIASLAVGLGAGVVAMSPIAGLSAFALLFVGAGWVGTLSTFNVTVQLAAPRWVAARALALYQMCTFGGVALGSFLWGAVAQFGNIRAAFVAAALLSASAPVLRRWAPIVDPDEHADDFTRRWREPAMHGRIRPSDGPILISIEYRIAEGDTAAFLALMSERRRNRLRNGALQWRLTEDLADKGVFTEQYECVTWADYIRHNRRTTRAEAKTADRLFALNEGGRNPLARRRIERLRDQD